MSNWKKLLRTLAVFMVIAMLLSTFAGCAKTGDSGSEGGENSGNEEEIVDTSKMSGEEHLQYVEGKSIDSALKVLTGTYGKMFAPIQGAQSGHIDVSVELGDEFMNQVIGGGATPGMDMSWLSEINMSMDVTSDNPMSKLELALGLAGTDILSASMILDMAEGQLWVGVPDLNSTYLKFDLEDLGVGDLNETAEALNMLIAAMPSEEVLSRVLDRYVDIILKNLDDVQKETVTLELDGLSQECTALTVEIGHEDVLKIAKAVLTEARDDEDLKNILEGIAKLYVAQGNASVDVWAMLQSEIDEMIEDLDEQLEDPQEGAIVLVTYADNKNHIIGRDITTPDGEAISYKTVTEGEKFAFLADLGGAQITGSGTNKSGKVTGTYELAVQGRTMLTVEVEDFDQNKLEKGYLCGTIRIKPYSYGVSEDSNGTVSVAPAIAQMEIELKLNTSAQAAEIQVNLNYQGEFFIGATIKVSSSSGGSVSAPGNAVDATNQTELMQWVQGMNFKKILNSLKSAGVPSQITSMLEQYINQMG